MAADKLRRRNLSAAAALSLCRGLHTSNRLQLRYIWPGTAGANFTQKKAGRLPTSKSPKISTSQNFVEIPRAVQHAQNIDTIRRFCIKY